MRIFYLDGFYFDDGFVPEGAKEITLEQHQQLLEGQAQGKQIITNENGLPILAEPAPSRFHHWQNGQWKISAEKQAEHLEQRRAVLIQQVADKTDSLKAQILVGYPQAEIDSFYRQEKEALAYQADNSVDTPMLKAIAEQRGVAFEVLVEKVLEKSHLFAGVMGAIIGQRQKFEDRVLIAKNLQELTACEQEVEQWQLSI